jgi:aspartate aminotransferase-like enzyme
MLQLGRFTFKQADTDAELEQVHRLNYQTFVRELAQHNDAGTGLLVDKFHDKNVYFICLTEAGQVVGMVSAHDRAPFSVAARLRDPSLLTQPGTRPLEVRLLAIEPGERHRMVFAGLIWTLYTYARSQGHTHLFISGYSERVSLYEHLGFETLGPALPSGAATFVPMGAPLERLASRMARSIQLWMKRLQRNDELDVPSVPTVSFVPGPVPMSQAVQTAFQQPPQYHRSPAFTRQFERVRRRLGRLVGGRSVALLTGSGTLANEAVAATLAAAPHAADGLLLVNGEFGHRLRHQARRFGLRPQVLTWQWGQPWDLDAVAAELDELPPGGWVWGVHHETSTGVLNDLPGLIRMATARGIRVVVDCVSSLGAVPVDLSQVYLAAGASGKALGSYAGLALIFADEAALASVDTSRVPTYLDVPAALHAEGTRFTVSAPLIAALEAALDAYDRTDRFAEYAATGAWLRAELRAAGVKVLAHEADACPVVTTFLPPAHETAETFLARCANAGFVLGGQSGYLAERGYVQIATMGQVARTDLERFVRFVRPSS